MNTEYYTIGDDRLARVLAELSAYDPDMVRAHLLADWPEGQAHQEWLDTAPVLDIARWVADTLYYPDGTPVRPRPDKRGRR
jgi:hypothetical protein